LLRLLRSVNSPALSSSIEHRYVWYMHRALVLGLVLSAGCAPQYFVSDVHSEGDALVVTKCAFGFDGQPTNLCHEETDADTAYGPDEVVPDPAELRKVKRQLDAPVEKRAAPTDVAIAKAMSAKGVHASLELCRSAYAPAVTSVDVSLTVAPTGEITQLVTNAPNRELAQCADHALRTANILAYDGPEVHSDVRVAL
jgi:hypothetical protein